MVTEIGRKLRNEAGSLTAAISFVSNSQEINQNYQQKISNEIYRLLFINFSEEIVVKIRTKKSKSKNFSSRRFL
jgi:hypothetical protein